MTLNMNAPSGVCGETESEPPLLPVAWQTEGIWPGRITWCATSELVPGLHSWRRQRARGSLSVIPLHTGNVHRPTGNVSKRNLAPDGGIGAKLSNDALCTLWTFSSFSSSSCFFVFFDLLWIV